MPPLIGHSDARHRQSVLAFLGQASIINLLSVPIIYSLALPLLLLDLWTTSYQWLCFPMYGMRLVSRRDHFVIDRHKLPYLNPIEKLHCFYCSYATGLFSYVREIAARTEQYWCPIRHATAVQSPHDHYRAFVDYGDAATYRHRLGTLRRMLSKPQGRRAAAAFDHPVDALVMRMQDAFLETPGLRLTLPEAERRFGLDRFTCEAILGVLVDAGVLTRSLDGAYIRFFPRWAEAA